MSQRQIAHNNINEYSSRSHTIMALQIELEMVSCVVPLGSGLEGHCYAFCRYVPHCFSNMGSRELKFLSSKIEVLGKRNLFSNPAELRH